MFGHIKPIKPLGFFQDNFRGSDWDVTGAESGNPCKDIGGQCQMLTFGDVVVVYLYKRPSQPKGPLGFFVAFDIMGTWKQSC